MFMNEFTSSCNIQMLTKNVIKHIFNKTVANLPTCYLCQYVSQFNQLGLVN